MSVSVSHSLAHVEQGRSTCNVSRSLSVELFCFAACVCHVCLLRFLARSLTSSKDDRPAMPVALSLSSFLLCNVRLSVHLTVERYGVRWPARSQNHSKIMGSACLPRSWAQSALRLPSAQAQRATSTIDRGEYCLVERG